MVSEPHYPYAIADVEPVPAHSGRPVSALAKDLLAVWKDHITPGGQCQWNLNVLCYARDANTVLETEDAVLIHAHVLMRYLQTGLPRSFVLDPVDQARAEALREELRSLVGGEV